MQLETVDAVLEHARQCGLRMRWSFPGRPMIRWVQTLSPRARAAHCGDVLGEIVTAVDPLQRLVERRLQAEFQPHLVSLVAVACE